MVNLIQVHGCFKEAKRKQFSRETEKQVNFPFPVKEKLDDFPNFPRREKVGETPRFSQGRKMYPLTGGNRSVSLTVNGGK